MSEHSRIIHGVCYSGESHQVENDSTDHNWYEYRITAACVRCGAEIGDEFDSLYETYNGIRAQRLNEDSANAAIVQYFDEIESGLMESFGPHVCVKE